MELKDYLHLYGIGCPISTIDSDGRVLSIYTKGVCVALDSILNGQELHGIERGNGGLHRVYLYKDNLVSLLLRPLSDMTEDESKECWALTNSNNQEIEGWQVVDYFRREYNFYEPKTFHYLLSKHFDLFGLIPAGLAFNHKNQSK